MTNDFSVQVPYAKPIPKNFQAQWNEQRSSKDILSEFTNRFSVSFFVISNWKFLILYSFMVAGSDEGGAPDSKMLLNKLFEHAPGAVNVRDLKVDAMFVYGKVVTLTGICWSSVLGCICTSPMANSIIIRFAIGEIVDACSEFCHRVLINILCLHVNLVVKYLFSNNYPSLRNDIVSRRLKSSNVSSFCE